MMKKIFQIFVFTISSLMFTLALADSHLIGSVTTDIETVDRSISPTEAHSDRDIARKITRIMQATHKFEDIQIKTQEGVVSISATAVSLEYVDWPKNVAQKIDGVIGVVSDVHIKKMNYLDLNLFKNQFEDLWKSASTLLPTIIMGIVVFILFFMLARPMTRFVTRPVETLTDSKLLSLVIQKSCTVLFCLLGLYMFLRISGLTQIAVAIISGTGLIGLIVGFAFKDIAENYLSSLLMSVNRPFRVKDVIEVNGYTGVVQKVTLRGTTLVDFDGNHVQIPNSVIYKGTIKNFTANPNMRGAFTIGIGYDTPIAKAQALGLRMLKEHPAILNEPEPQILVESLGSSTINFKVYFWINSQKYALNKVLSEAMRLFVDIYLKEGISMPDDAREVIFPEGIKLINQANEIKDNTDNKLDDHKQEYRNDLDHPIENNLHSDVDEVTHQAATSRQPDDGTNII